MALPLMNPKQTFPRQDYQSFSLDIVKQLYQKVKPCAASFFHRKPYIICVNFLLCRRIQPLQALNSLKLGCYQRALFIQVDIAMQSHL